tara:strand:- start:70 stop:789 length:720 start_codon:yes stop_codon:yes gene_type:complete
MKQSVLTDEIIIADDGSTNETKILIESYKKKFKNKLKHIWQKDDGFQKTIILNKAILLAKGDYIIQIDGDIILHKHFIKDHIKNAQTNTFIHGSRVFLNRQTTQTAIKQLFFKFSFYNNGISNRLNGIRSTFLSKIISRKNKKLKGTRGCNFSFWKQDFMKVNGYNEDMKGWGKEDTELSVRLMNIGLKKHQLKYLAICYHLNHKLSKRKGLNINNTILANTISENKIFCKNGINKHVN